MNSFTNSLSFRLRLIWTILMIIGLAVVLIIIPDNRISMTVIFAILFIAGFVMVNVVKKAINAEFLQLGDELDLKYQELKKNYENKSNYRDLSDERKMVHDKVDLIMELSKDKFKWYEEILDAIPFPLSVTDMDMNWTLINKPVEQLLGVKRGSVVGKQCHNWNANICKTKDCGINKLRNNQPRTFFDQMGMSFQVDTSYLYNRKGEKVGHVEVVQDVSVLKKDKDYSLRELDSVLAVLNSISQGDLTSRYTPGSADKFSQDGYKVFSSLSSSLNMAISHLGETLRNVQDNMLTLNYTSESLTKQSVSMTRNTDDMTEQSSMVAASTEQISANVNTLISAANEMSNAVGSVATAIEEMSSTLNDLSKNTQQSNQITQKANSKASGTGEVMKQLNTSANEIGKIVKVINDIADQTNMLALNATIEAASAGEAGKGFAVVANEVKELAKQTSEATNKIANQIQDIQKVTKDAVASIDEIINVISELNQISGVIASSLEEQSITTNEITRNILSANRVVQTVNQNVKESSLGLNEIARNIQVVNGSAQDVARGSSEIKNGSITLADMAKGLTQALKKFRL